MVKQVLVVLDASSRVGETAQHAAEVAERTGARVKGIGIWAEGAGSAAGKEKAEDAVREFEEEIRQRDLSHVECTREGMPVSRIVDEMRYHDLLVTGREPHFLFSSVGVGKDLLEDVLEETCAPMLTVGEGRRATHRVLVAYDGSGPSARALKQFVQLCPFGREVEVRVLNVSDRSGEAKELVEPARSYLEAHGFDVFGLHAKGEDLQEWISRYVREGKADIVVAGVRPSSGLRRLVFGSATEELLEESPVPLFLHR